ncbi:MAG: hypothetical protein H2174_02940 [Vampirovibrio sp.]|nr:hypothetical protein [Vampirovibrio sp.]
MNSVQDFNTSRYGQQQQPNGLPTSSLPRQSMETGMNLPASAVPPAFASSTQPRTTAPSIAEQQALINQLSQAGYRIDDSRLREIDRLTAEQRFEKETMAGMGAGLMGMGFGGDKLYDFGQHSTQKAGQFVKDKWVSEKWLDKFDEMGEATSLRQAGLQRNATGALELADASQRTGLKGLWNRNKGGVQAVNHAEYMEAAKQLKLQEVKKANMGNSLFTDDMVRNSPESAVTGAGKFGKQVKKAISPLTDAVGNLGKDIARGVDIDMTPTPTPAPAIKIGEAVHVEKYNLKNANFVKEVPPITTPKVGFFKDMKSALDAGDKMKFATGVGGKALGIAGIGLTAYSVGSNAIDNYKNQNYRAIATDITAEAVGLVTTSVATGVISAGLTVAAVAAVAAFPPLAMLAPVAPFVGPIASGILGGLVGQGATNLTRWAVDPFFKLCGLKNRDDDTKSKIKENRELLTNVAAGTGSAIGHALSTMPRQGTPNPSMFGSAGSSVVKGALNY